MGLGEATETMRAVTGVRGLDQVLDGGFPRGRMHLIEGDPGSGKTTLALQFLLEGARQGEPGVYVVLSETQEELAEVAASHGWSLDSIAICDLQAVEESLKVESQYTLFHPAEVELSDTTQCVLEAVDRVQPLRVAFDSLSEMRLLARDSLRFRRQILALKHFLTSRRCTVLLLDYRDPQGSDFQIQSLVHGVIQLEQLAPEYGGQRRRLRVQKMRGCRFRDGFHDFHIQTGGIVIYPRLAPAPSGASRAEETVPSGVEELDGLLGGGLDRATSTLILGPAGVGKSSLAAQYAWQAMERGETAALFSFDEFPETLRLRLEGMGLSPRRYLENGRLLIRKVEPAELSPGEFAAQVREAVEQHGASVLVIDSINGYRNAMPEEHYLNAHLHELLGYLCGRQVTTLLILSQHGILGEGLMAPLDISYLADTVILLRYFEAAGEVRQAISVVKKRSGSHERTIREFQLGPGGVRLGRTLREFQGVLTGQLVFTGGEKTLLDGSHDRSGA